MLFFFILDNCMGMGSVVQIGFLLLVALPDTGIQHSEKQPETLRPTLQMLACLKGSTC